VLRHRETGQEAKSALTQTARLNDDCRPHPTTFAAAPHYPHARPQDVPARLVYQRILVNTYCTSDLCRPRGRARPPSDPCARRASALTCSGAGVDLPGFGRGRSDMSDCEDDVLAARGALGSRTCRSADRDHDRHRPYLGRKPQRHLGMSRGDGRGASNRTC
jgi:hypothetical protein